MNNFIKYGIKISKLELKDIETLRQWRNDPKISKVMLSQNGHHITKEEQLNWFNSLADKSDAIYYMAFVDDLAVGYFCFHHR